MQEDFFEEDEQNEQDELFVHHRFVATAGQSKVRVDKFLTNYIENISRNKVQKAADAGCVQVNGVAVKSNYNVKAGDDVTMLMAFPPRETTILPEDIPLNIVYRDADVIVVNKNPHLMATFNTDLCSLRI